MKVLKNLFFFTFLFFCSFGYSKSIPDSIPVETDSTQIEDLLKAKTEKKQEAPLKEESQETKKVEPIEEQPLQEEQEPLFNVEEKKETPILPIVQEKPLQEEEKTYTKAGIVELGGMLWGQIRAITKGYDAQFGSANLFFHYFLIDYFLVGTRLEGSYYFDDKTYQASGYGVIGGAFPLSSSFFLSLTVNVGYSKNNTALSKSLFSYGNEVGFKIKLQKNYLLGFSVLYSFYTDFTKDFFNDKIKGTISFSGYF